MTEEELNKKAEKYFSHHNYALHNRYSVQKDIHRMIYIDGWKDCQKDLLSWTDREQLEKENAKLKELVEEYKQTEKEYAELKVVSQNRKHCIDWIMKHYPEVITKYLEREDDLQ